MMERNDFLILLTQGRSDNLNMGFRSGPHTSKETVRQDGGTPLRSKLGGKDRRSSVT